MPGLMQNLIVSAAPDPATYTVRLTWQDGSVTSANFTAFVGREAFAAFADAGFFRQVQVLDEGRVLAWPEDLEFDADALWFAAHPEDLPLEAAVAHP